jgi:cobalt-zinc-cadmium efflux system membrane fusion protein
MKKQPTSSRRAAADNCIEQPKAGVIAAESWWRRLLPNLMVIAVIGLAAWFGHHTEWTFGLGSRHEQTNGQAGVATSLTLETAAEFGVASHLCSAHGVFDCPHCYPERAQLDPQRQASPEELERVRAALALRLRAEVPPSAMQLPRVVRFPSVEAVDRAGIEVSPVERARVMETLAASGELLFDQGYVARIPARVAGLAWRVDKQTGSAVRANEILAFVESAAVSNTKSELQQALVQVRLKRQAYTNIQDAPVAERQKREAQAELRNAESRLLSAEQALINLGFTLKTSELVDLPAEAVSRKLQLMGLPSELAHQPEDTLPGSLLPIRATFDGVILDSNVIAGEVVAPDQILFTVVDPRHMWVTLSVAASDIGLVRIGQEVRFRPDGSSRTVSGPVAWIGSTADERTRTIPVRVNVSNADGALRAFSLGQGEIVLRVDFDAIVVPSEAVQSLGDTPFVFVRNKDYFQDGSQKEFYLRAVRLGGPAGDNQEVIAGVVPGEIVATKGSGMLLNEVTKNQPVRLAVMRRSKPTPVITARSEDTDSDAEKK